MLNSVRLQELKGKIVFQRNLFFPVCMEKYVALCATVINSSNPCYFILLLFVYQTCLLPCTYVYFTVENNVLCSFGSYFAV